MNGKRFRGLLSMLPAILLAGGFMVSSAFAAAAGPGPEVCKACHTDKFESYSASKHSTKTDPRTPASVGGCVVCHTTNGDATAHVNAGGGRGVGGIINPASKTLAANDKDKICLTCHGKDANRTHWEGGQHQANGVACTNCHTMHAPTDKVRDKKTQTEVCFTCHKDQRVDSRKISHHPIGEGKVVCSNCHNPHGSPGPKLLKKNTVNETCFTCHAEKRGPFLWEHQPVAEDCTNCHTVHGSNISPMLKSRPPFLCNECHDGPHASKSPNAASAAGMQGGLTATYNSNNVATGLPSESYTGRACMNCHSMVHGSNNPAGALLHR